METFDVEPLYTNTDSEYAIKCLTDLSKEFRLRLYELKITDIETLLRACQKGNIFCFSGSKQRIGSGYPLLLVTAYMSRTERNSIH